MIDEIGNLKIVQHHELFELISRGRIKIHRMLLKKSEILKERST